LRWTDGCSEEFDWLEQAIKKPPSWAVDLESVALNAVFVKVMQAETVLDDQNPCFGSRNLGLKSAWNPGLARDSLARDFGITVHIDLDNK
jgi:hypothetical protein